MVALASCVAPENAPTHTPARLRLGWQMLMRTDHIARCSFKMEPGKITRPAAHERLHESKAHNQEARMEWVEPGFDLRAQQVGKRHAKCAAQHQIRHDPQRRQKDAEPKKEN